MPITQRSCFKTSKVHISLIRAEVWQANYNFSHCKITGAFFLVIVFNGIFIATELNSILSRMFNLPFWWNMSSFYFSGSLWNPSNRTFMFTRSSRHYIHTVVTNERCDRKNMEFHPDYFFGIKANFFSFSHWLLGRILLSIVQIFALLVYLIHYKLKL